MRSDRRTPPTLDPTVLASLLSAGLCTIAEAARMLAVSRSFLYVVMDRGELPFCKIGRARRIPRSAVLQYAARHLRGGWRGEGQP